MNNARERFEALELAEAKLTAVYETLAYLFDTPCDYGFEGQTVDEYMADNAGSWCEEHCDDNNYAECWRKFLSLKLAERTKPICSEQECAPVFGDKEDCVLNDDGACVGKKPCASCDNAGWESMGKVAACNCCESYEFYTPRKEEKPQEIRCKACGALMVWENPHLPGHWHESSCYLGDGWPLCEECMTDHCESSNCLGCEYGKYPDCRFYGDKKHHRGKEKQE